MGVVQQLPMLVLLYLVAFLLTATYVPHLQVKPKPHNNITDLASLLSFKEHVVDPEGVLSTNWILNSTTPSFCSWIGVRCSRRHQHRVVSLRLMNVTLQEYGLTGEVSKMSDVYSFGILLLEIFTRIKPTNVSDGEQSLRERILKAYPEALLNIVDDNLLNIGSHSGNTTMHQCISSIIELGLLCSRDSPKERIQMIVVVPRLQKIKAGYLLSSQYTSA